MIRCIALFSFAAALAGCSSASDSEADKSNPASPPTQTENILSAQTDALKKAKAVEAQLQEQAKARDAQIDAAQE